MSSTFVLDLVSQCPAVTNRHLLRHITSAQYHVIASELFVEKTFGFLIS